MAQELNAFEKEEILKIAKNGVCRQNDILRYNSVSGRLETVATFNKDNLPQFDALLVIGGFPRPIYHAALVLRAYEKKFGNLPEFMTVGKHNARGQRIPASEVEMTEQAMVKLGFDKDYIMKNHIEPTGCEINGNVEDIRTIVRRSSVMNRKDQPQIAVISEHGVLLNLAQTLSFKISDYEFLYYETPQTPEKERTFVCERFDGYFTDIIIAAAFNSQRRWNLDRLGLSDSKINQMPSFDVIRKYVDKGYAFYMSPAMLRDLGYSENKIKELLDMRRLEVLGDESVVNSGMAEAKVEKIAQRFEEMIQKIKEQMQ